MSPRSRGAYHGREMASSGKVELGAPVVVRGALSLLVALGACSCGSGRDDTTPENEGLFFSGEVLAIAHGGGLVLGPDETLEIYRASDALGVDVLESDVRATADGVVVCIHDAEVDRTTDGTGRVDEMTFAELRRLDAGYHFTPDDGATFPFRGTGVVVQTLEELLDEFPQQHFIIEIKQDHPRIEAEVLRIIEAAGALDRVIIASMFDTVLWDIRQSNPEVYTSLGVSEMLEFVEYDEEYLPPARFLHPPFGSVDAEFVDAARRHDMRIHSWTVNERSDMEAQLALGVDGIMTDDPELLLTVIDELAP
jgi:glycerophosphoryl diester phosphodiesterase